MASKDQVHKIKELGQSSKAQIELSSIMDSWTLYFHDRNDKNWSIESFISIGPISSWSQFWAIINHVDERNFSKGMFFLMKGSVPPLWENSQNIRGGAYSFCVNQEEGGKSFVKCSIACMLGKISKERENVINGISITPKRNFNVIKIWNKDCVKFKEVDNIHMIVPHSRQDGSVMYTPFIKKKM